MGNKNKKCNIEICKNNNNIENKKEKNLDLFHTTQIDIHFIQDLTTESFCKYWHDNSFCLFKSYNDIYYIIYADKSQSIISLDLISRKKIIEIKNAHDNYITNFRHYFDKINKRDLLISLSRDDNNLKLWNINNFECLLNIEKVNVTGYLGSACFLNDNNNIFIVTSNNINKSYVNSKSIKILDLNGKQ